MPSKFGFNEVLRKVEQTKREVPKKVANATQNYFVLGFRKQGFNNNAWKEVKRRIPGTPEFEYPKTKGLSRRTKPILIGTGKMRRDVANSVVVAEWPTVKLVVNSPYAIFHNEGAGNLPKRQIVGQTKELSDKQTHIIETEFKKIW